MNKEIDKDKIKYELDDWDILFGNKGTMIDLKEYYKRGFKKVRIVPVDRLYAIESEKINKFQRDIANMAAKLKEIGHEDLAQMLDADFEEMIINNLEINRTGLDFKISNDSGEYIGKGKFDEFALRRLEFNMDYFVGVEVDTRDK